MTEVKPKIDRLYVDKKSIDDFNKLKESYSPFKAHYHELFIAAMAIGFHKGCPIEITNKKELFFEKDLTKKELALIRAIAVAEKGNIDVFLNKQEIYNIAEKYASGGIALLKNMVFGDTYGSYAKRLESELLRTFEKIEENLPAEVYIEDDSLPTLETLSVSELVNHLESNLIEFKESMHWDTKLKRANEELKLVIAKTIAAFMNSKGGLLLIGIKEIEKDKYAIVGIEPDLKIMRNSKDEFELTLTKIVSERLGKINRPYVDLKFERVEDKEVAVVRVRATPHEVFVKTDNNREEFYIRMGNSSVPLKPSEASVYIREHWTNR